MFQTSHDRFKATNLLMEQIEFGLLIATAPPIEFAVFTFSLAVNAGRA